MPTMNTKRATGVTPEETVRLLVSCIRNSNNGKINWTSVATELGITTNAASKRYKKVLDTHGIAGSSDASGTGASSAAPQKEKRKRKAGPTVGGQGASKNKKRKVQPDSEDEHPEEDEDQTGNLESLLNDDEDED